MEQVLLTVAGPRSLAIFSYTVDGEAVYYPNQKHDYHFNGEAIVKDIYIEPQSSAPSEGA